MPECSIWSVSGRISRYLVGVSAPTPTTRKALWHRAGQGFLLNLVGVSVSFSSFLEKRNRERKEEKEKKKLAGDTDTPTVLGGFSSKPLCHNDLRRSVYPLPTPTRHRLFAADTDHAEDAHA